MVYLGNQKQMKDHNEPINKNEEIEQNQNDEENYIYLNNLSKRTENILIT